MYCKECGKEIDNDSKFCSFCGMKQSIAQGNKNKTDLVNKTYTLYQNVTSSLANKEPSSKDEKIEGERDKYDRSYKGDVYATIVGVVMGLAYGMLLNSARQSPDEDYMAYFWVLTVIASIIALFMVVNIAKKQNRDTTFWGIFAFLLPWLALVIIGLSKKLNKQPSKPPMSGLNQVHLKEEMPSDNKINDTNNVEILLKTVDFDRLNGWVREAIVDFIPSSKEGNIILFNFRRNSIFFLTKEKYNNLKCKDEKKDYYIVILPSKLEPKIKLQNPIRQEI